MLGTRLGLRGTDVWSKAGFFDFAFLTFRLFSLITSCLMFCKYKYIFRFKHEYTTLYPQTHNEMEDYIR